MIASNHVIKAIIGLGNPGKQHLLQRHNIGFRIVDLLAKRHGGLWIHKDLMDISKIQFADHSLMLIKPQTYMNSSGNVLPVLTKQGIKSSNLLVIHDELELPLGDIKFKEGGSHKGHNGLRSIIGICGADFLRLRFGIGRPATREHVPDYVLQNFDHNDKDKVDDLIEKACDMIEGLFLNRTTI
jgi:peptidyl-tRNA hydrolase, PTH1 family